MSKRVTNPARTAIAALVAGMGVSAVLGSGVAFAGEPAVSSGSPVSAVASAVAAQAEAQAKAAKATAEAAKKAEAAAKKAWQKPVSKYTLTATFGKAGNMWSSNHSGQDFAVPVGTKVSAVGSGTVVKAGPNGAGDGPAYGNAVVIKHDNDTYSQYAHLSRVDVKPGQKVKVGQRIALSGNTGNSSGPHLHFEIRKTPNYGSAINPVKYLRSEGVSI
ncbi:M23 family metallopeptidase [Streptomyces sp. HNM0663]|uniref:M23 family metallopeptidase n=1 Tax=Streptomyces chengmaiensis TaxID=3040919 RepID=A0ABT6HI44_9ACTN|nr:M23 family metallopeptidase [Streptomyces chengmaiensis]MDH2387544.1 M23 family metallopeptidase [Streptomyces chengmaiensis]